MTRTAVPSPPTSRAVDPLRAARARRAAPGRYERLKDARVPAEGLAQGCQAEPCTRERLQARLAAIDAAKAKAAGAKRLKLQEEALHIERRLASMSLPQRGALVTGAVADPYEPGAPRLQATIDRRVDVLEEELSHQRISQAAYLKGREIQALLEALGRQPSASWDGASRGDPVMAREMRHKAIIEGIEAVRRLEATIVGRIGMIDWRLIRSLIGDRTSFAAVAAARGRAGDRGARYFAARFRDALEDLAEATAAKGAARPAPDDAHRAASTQAPARQAAALRGGATRRRLTGEKDAAIAAATRAPTLRERQEAASAAGEIGLQLAGIELVTAVQRSLDAKA